MLHKLSKDWIVVFPPELDSVVNEALHVSSSFKRWCFDKNGHPYKSVLGAFLSNMNILNKNAPPPGPILWGGHFCQNSGTGAGKYELEPSTLWFHYCIESNGSIPALIGILVPVCPVLYQFTAY